ncbi:MAG TPA: DUF3703 domain-containing protein [Polyangiaceae bacterium]|nr:DUF3703 domain-containing protein [Polyangiaceae bacterium]
MDANGNRGAARAAFEQSLERGRVLFRGGDLEGAWAAFERAHVLGQPEAWPHVLSHLWMLRCGLRQRDLVEVLGQLGRVPLAAPASWLGRYPRGNTGRARVGLFRPMAAPPEVGAPAGRDAPPGAVQGGGPA